MAAIDSDEDGGTNGTELLDPDGNWQRGDSDPGNPDDVTNPGDAQSVSGIDYSSHLPQRYHIRNYPNPFNSSTVIEIDVEKSSKIKVDLFNAQGKLILTLVNTRLDPGSYRYFWSGNAADGTQVSSGLYLARLQNQEFTKTVTMILLR